MSALRAELLLAWIVPPAIGAVIGWVTNAIAIKMLFRPLNEIRIFRGKGRGIRVPFTPGILPRERKKLAASIGSMVERELLTPEIIRERLRRESVREGTKNAVLEIGLQFTEPGGEGAKVLESLAEGILPGIWPSIAEKIARFLKKSDTREKLIRQGREIIEDVRENRLSVFQRFFVEAGNYDRTIMEKMPEIVDGMIGRVETLLSGRDIPAKLAAAFLEPPSGEGKVPAPGTAPDPAWKEKTAGLIAGKILEGADRNIEKLLAALDVRAMVEDRINSLEMIRVEKIVLDVMANQFKWINLFGAILGALIGMVQVLFSRAMK